MATNHGSRGKHAENAVQVRLQELSNSRHVTWARWPDARAGSLQPAFCDFMLFYYGQTMAIEVKQTEHEYRLSHGNMDIPQVARLRALTWANVKAVVLIYHSKLDLWRGFPISRFVERDGGSWDLRDQTPTSLENLLERPQRPTGFIPHVPAPASIDQEQRALAIAGNPGNDDSAPA